MASKKFYAVAAGRRPGIYTAWTEAEAQVKGFPKPRFKGFATRAEAESWIEEEKAAPRRTTCRNTTAKAPAPLEIRPEEVQVYTDGGALNNPGPGGYGVVVIDADGKKEFSGGYRLTTNNRMELMACIVALRQLAHTTRPIVLHSDSSYVVNGINKGWAKKWRKNGWIKSDKKPAVNPDLWAELLDLSEGLDIAFRWVKGHAGNPLNERCDALAVASARSAGLPVDAGYKAGQGS
jgi:ribonuclease HI